MQELGETDSEDRWIYGSKPSPDHPLVNPKQRRYPQERQGYRVAIRSDARPEILEGLRGIQWVPNPRHPVVFVRYDHFLLPFKGTRNWFDLDGGNITIGSPSLQQSHQSWSGDGAWYLIGNSQMRGRKWNEPFPSDIHYLAAVRCGDISPAGHSGRWITGSGNVGALVMADLRSGDGWTYLPTALSQVHSSKFYDYRSSSALEDNDAKGSPDGTKICFVSNYDLKNGPVTKVAENMAPGDNRIVVESTEGFPASGRLDVRNEVIGYERKTATSFEGLTRGMYATTPEVPREFDDSVPGKYSPPATGIRTGQTISSFEHRYIPEDKRKGRALPSRFAGDNFRDDRNSALIWQNRTDIYTAVVRLPDRPWIREIEGRIELIPGENHWETFGYHIYRNGKKLTDDPVRPGSQFSVTDAGQYSTVAVEWSGLESSMSPVFEISGNSTIHIREDKPADFSWTFDRWLVDGKEVTNEVAQNTQDARRDIVHRLEGVIHREWYNWGQITRRHDLNRDGLAMRRLFYRDGAPSRREFHNRQKEHTSTELFDKDGSITESILYQYNDDRQSEREHYWYDHGMPIKYIGRGGRDGTGLFMKEGDQWVKKE